MTDAMLASVVGGLLINSVAPRGPCPHPRCRDAVSGAIMRRMRAPARTLIVKEIAIARGKSQT